MVNKWDNIELLVMYVTEYFVHKQGTQVGTRKY